MKAPLRAAAIAFALSAAVTVVQAHNAWLLPSTTVFSKADTVTIDAAVSNDLFVANHNPLRLSAIDKAAWDRNATEDETADMQRMLRRAMARDAMTRPTRCFLSRLRCHVCLFAERSRYRC